MVAIRIPVLITFIVSLIGAAYLGFASIQLNHDKLIHFATFFILTLEFYFVFDTKHKSLKTLRWITFITCTVVASVLSEVVQTLVNSSRVFDVYDIACNVSGSALGLALGSGYDVWTIRKYRQARYRQLRSDLTNEIEEDYVSVNMVDISK